jgi:Na+/H+ antiporter NhaD/arsenite permease-like protein
LIGVTLLFAQAHVNGTLDKVAHFAVRGCRGDLGLIPLMFFLLTAILSSIGAATSLARLMAPPGHDDGSPRGIPPLLMAIVVAHGALAGALSPVSPTGIIADKLMHELLGLSGFETRLYLYNLAANAVVGLGGYLLLGGWRWFGRKHCETAALPDGTVTDGWPRANVATLVVIVLLIVGVIFFKVHVGMGAFAAAVLLTLLRAADERKSMQMIPWGVILMVCGVTVLTSLLEKRGVWTGLPRSSAGLDARFGHRRDRVPVGRPLRL